MVAVRTDVGYNLTASDIIVTQHEVYALGGLDGLAPGQKPDMSKMIATLASQATKCEGSAFEQLTVLGSMDLSSEGDMSVTFKSADVDCKSAAAMEAVSRLLEKKAFASTGSLLVIQDSDPDSLSDGLELLHEAGLTSLLDFASAEGWQFSSRRHECLRSEVFVKYPKMLLLKKLAPVVPYSRWHVYHLLEHLSSSGWLRQDWLDRQSPLPYMLDNDVAVRTWYA